MKYLKSLMLAASMLSLGSCSNYLDIVPDNVATIDNAFNNRLAAEKFLFGCFNYLPNQANPDNNPGFFAGDEFWWNLEQTEIAEGELTGLARGLQNSSSPYFNYWDGGRGGRNLFIGIRDCNIFLENINKPSDLSDFERKQWIAEVKFIKAYLHMYLMQLYGPVPIIDVNLPISSKPDEVRLYREPVEKVAEYVIRLLDEAKKDLPIEIMATVTDAGRPTIPIVLAVKAKLLAWMASPLFNGNLEYKDMVDNRGIHLFPTEYKKEKWDLAAKALKNAIDTCHLAGNKLYTYLKVTSMSDSTAQKLTLRNAITERFNPELVWASTDDVEHIQRRCFPRFQISDAGSGCAEYCVSLKTVEQFYTNKGIPMNEDPDYDYVNRFKTQPGDATNRYYIKQGETTAKLHFNREPRFYAWVGFDRGIFEGAGKTNDKDSWFLQIRKGEMAGFRSNGEHIPSGYYAKKLANYETVIVGNAQYNSKRYSFPIIRLADLYLLYAEALNESKATPDASVYEYIDKVRQRAGLKGVVESWKASTFSSKPTTQDGMRQIIRQERLIELSYEMQRFWDLRRWKQTEKEYNEPFMGWNYKGETAEEFYSLTVVDNKRRFLLREYLWPLSVNAISINSNLVQNPGW